MYPTIPTPRAGRAGPEGPLRQSPRWQSDAERRCSRSHRPWPRRRRDRSRNPPAAGLCETGLARDYAAPLRALPPIPAPPATIPFAPEGVALRSRTGPLLSGGGRVGYRLAYAPGARTAGGLSPALDWVVVARLGRVAAGGGEVRRLGKRVEVVNRIRASRAGAVDLSFEAPGPGTYRVDLALIDLDDGERLARYGQYVRVLRPLRDVRLALSAPALRAGETLAARLENYGTQTLTYGLERSIEVFDGTAWAPAPGFEQGAIPAIAVITGPGEWSSCWSVPIPPGQPPGYYRFVWRGNAADTPHSTPKPLIRAAEFQIY